MLKGALHVHSDVSPDSQVSRLKLREIFKNAGYHFLMVTEHAEDLNPESYQALVAQYQALSDETFLIIPGLEIKWGERVHLLAYGARQHIASQVGLPMPQALRAIRETTQCDLLVWAHVNHPVRLDETLIRAMPLADGVEVLNANYHGLRFPDARGLYYANRIRRAKEDFLVFGGLDMHGIKKYDALYCVLPEARDLRRQEIIGEFKRGAFIPQSEFCSIAQSRYSAGHLVFLFLGNLYVTALRRIRRKGKAVVKFLKRSSPLCRPYAN